MHTRRRKFRKKPKGILNIADDVYCRAVESENNEMIRVAGSFRAETYRDFCMATQKAIEIRFAISLAEPDPNPEGK